MQVVKAGVAWGLFAEILSQCTGCITRNDYCGSLLGPWLDPHGFDSQWQKPFVLSESFEPCVHRTKAIEYLPYLYG
jgi:hypothetical protein